MFKLSKILWMVIGMLLLLLTACTSKAAWTRPADKMVMVYVPAGKFTMGRTAQDALAVCSKYENDCALSDFTDEQPPHTVSLDAFRIDETDVTNAMYAKCVSAGACKKPLYSGSDTRLHYYGNPLYDNYPVIYVNWDMAEAYCKWAGVRLPTEAEWEKAAVGTDGRNYPWGNQTPTCSLTNFGLAPTHYITCKSDTTAVDSYPSGASPYKALDMEGNVFNWVNDWYSASYYASSTASNPIGPASGQYHVLRGGNWEWTGGYELATNRHTYNPAAVQWNLSVIGFRCAVSAP